MKTNYKIVPPPVDEAAIQRQYAAAAQARQARQNVRGSAGSMLDVNYIGGDPEAGLAWEWSGKDPASWDILLATDEAGEVFEALAQLPGSARGYLFEGETPNDGVYQIVARNASGAAGASKKVPKSRPKLHVVCDFGVRWDWRYKNPDHWAIYVTTGTPPATACVDTVPGHIRSLGFEPAMGGFYSVVG